MKALSTDSRYDSLPFPIRNGGKTISADPETLINRGTEFFGSGNHANRGESIAPKAEMKIISTGRMELLVLKATPCITRESGDGSSSTLAMPYAGGVHKFRDGTRNDDIFPGDIHLNPRNGGSVTVGYFSGLIAKIEHRQLERTVSAMSGCRARTALGKSIVIRGALGRKGEVASGRIWSFMEYIDQLLGESRYLPACLGLDEQVYRLLALSIFETLGTFEQIQERWSINAKKWTNSLDELVDYIRANAHLNLTLTDLEEQSHYSARHLQNLFREKLYCTPMQFVRRQRLSTAMEKLQTADWDDTVTSISRDCGYRFTSNFSSDFQREFGVAPSVVLRTSRSPGHKV